jgi:hypothetical protein
MRIFLRRIFLVLLLASAGSARADSLEEGARDFTARDFGRAREVLAAELARRPGDVLTSLWLGLAIHATDGVFAGADQWRTATGHPRYESMAEFFRGLSYWKAGYVDDARAYFLETQLNTRDGKSVDYPPARQALADLEAGRPVPAVETWPALAGLPTAFENDTPPAPQPRKGDTQPAAPVTPQEVAPPTRPAQPIRGYRPWEPAGTHRVGDRVLFRVINGEWRTGIVQEVGTTGAFRDKYLIAQEDRPDSKDYYYHTDVTGPERADFWTAFFVGEWALGSGMSVTQRTEGSNTRDEYLYVGASETLVINPDGTYTWATPGAPVRRGRWRPHPTAPGLVIERGIRDRDYDVFNITDAATVSVMKEHHLRLQTTGIQSTLGRRKIP